MKEVQILLIYFTIGLIFYGINCDAFDVTLTNNITDIGNALQLKCEFNCIICISVTWLRFEPENDKWLEIYLHDYSSKNNTKMNNFTRIESSAYGSSFHQIKVTETIMEDNRKWKCNVMAAEDIDGINDETIADVYGRLKASCVLYIVYTYNF